MDNANNLYCAPQVPNGPIFTAWPVSENIGNGSQTFPLGLTPLTNLTQHSTVVKTTTPRPGYGVSTTEIIADATIFLNALGSGRRYVNISAAGGTLVRSAHLEGRIPSGGNITFLDGHIEWRKFMQMTNVANPSGGNPGFMF